MNRKTLALVHTSSALAPLFDKLCKEKNLNVDLVHIEDASLIKDVIADGMLTASTSARVRKQLAATDQSNADYIMVTCSSIGAAVDEAQTSMKKPLLRVDQPLADQAVKLGSKIGVVATLVTTMVPTTELIRRRAAEIGKAVEVKTALCEGAFEAFSTGKQSRHDEIVCDAVRKLAKEVDVIVLAQASMASAVVKLELEEIGVPILSSPSLAIDYLASVL